MQHEKALTTIVGENLTSRLDVSLQTDSQGRKTVELRRLSWGDGVGWYGQQTLCLDLKETACLLHALKQTRLAWQDRPMSNPRKVIPFPLSPMSREEQRSRSSRNGRKKQTSNTVSALSSRERRGTKQRKDQTTTSRA